ncbi:hypothetical protein HMPREF1325_1817 [Treponema socranskii subsp. socranskii VPI DR56BR1116 = ATCC 35536]|uniref:Uncharacterized protein n=1 Tax=Treponema socranskii subsp. socranskii VPI DR56BR1116 = ATCC 35536 TaxID=1125725 RepID=U1FCD5_TRESO|nr:hypothetical protein HMPREF1325_1817 [Treponema socranskii subsp. socranskii VPI DR56BR1116 = ATCC 35536]
MKSKAGKTKLRRNGGTNAKQRTDKRTLHSPDCRCAPFYR